MIYLYHSQLTHFYPTVQTVIAVRDSKCLGCDCFKPKVQGKKGSCITKAENGCPKETNFSEAVRSQRLRDGWRYKTY